MIKVAVISDSHGGKVRLEMFAKIARQEQFDAIIHCGDGVSDAKWLRKNLEIEVFSIAGNCDFYTGEAREKTMQFEKVRMLAVHGDLFDVKLDLTRLSYHAEECGAQVALFGHTHRPYAGRVGNVQLINPGALKEGRYAELLIQSGEVIPFLRAF